MALDLDAWSSLGYNFNGANYNKIILLQFQQIQ